MDELKEPLGWLDSIKTTLQERIASPFLGAFALSWFAYNYRFIWVLFSDYDTDYKFSYIDIFLYPSSEIFWNHWVYYPLYTVAVFFIVYPIPSLIAYAISSYTKVGFQIINLKVRKIKPVEQKTVNALYNQLSSLELEKDKTNEEHKVLVDSLKKSIEEGEYQLNERLSKQTISVLPSSENDPDEQRIKNELDKEDKEFALRLAREPNAVPSKVIDDFSIEWKNTFEEIDPNQAVNYMRDLIMIFVKDFKAISQPNLERLISSLTGFSDIRVEDFINGMVGSLYISPSDDGKYYSMGDNGISHLLGRQIDNKSVGDFMKDYTTG